MCHPRRSFAAIILLCAACKPDDPAGPIEARTGGIAVSVATQGDSLDPDGYLVVVNRIDGAGGSEYTQSVGGSGELTFSSMAPGQYDVALENLAQHCKLQDSTLATRRRAVVAPGEISRLAFGVMCSTKTPGRLRITVWTTFDRAPTLDDLVFGFPLLIDDQPAGRVPANGLVELESFQAGLHTVGLKTRNCLVGTDGAVPPNKTATIRMPAGGSAEVKFRVVCMP